MNENDVKNAMRQALNAEPDDGPDMEEIVRGGRKQRRAIVRQVALGTAVLAVAGFGVGYSLTHAQAGSKDQSVTTDLAGQARTPSLPPHDNSRANLDKAHADLRAALVGRLPAGMTLEDGSGPSDFNLVRSDGTVTELGTLVGLQNLAGAKNPCTDSQINSNCQPVSLADGSRGWAWEAAAQQDGYTVTVRIYTQDGQAWGLSNGATAVNPKTQSLEKGQPLTAAQLISLVSDPEVMAALKEVPTDQITPTQAGQPYHL
ncbi:hypothetical protein [Streptomyces sp. NPDC008317]|uniref:hypothetical protein n=1 Tax=Streptomyces sp. NPDC008317 TaxID=3364827 RepID=UPI0036EE146C